jgi:putative toxin-antitoxin system antitoxin component (TIGR02293 family)
VKRFDHWIKRDYQEYQMSTTSKREAKTSAITRTRDSRTGVIRGKSAGCGVVLGYVQGSSKRTADADLNPANVVKVLEAGLPVTELTDLQASLAIPADKLAPMLGISKATFHRRKGAGSKLKPAVSDRVVRFARLLGKAVDVFGDLEDAKQWLNSAQFGLGGAVPLEYAKTEVGAREVENLLGRIEYGVYS